MYLRRSRVNDQTATFGDGRSWLCLFSASAAYGAVIRRANARRLHKKSDGLQNKAKAENRK